MNNKNLNRLNNIISDDCKNFDLCRGRRGEALKRPKVAIISKCHLLIKDVSLFRYETAGGQGSLVKNTHSELKTI
jgi:hypothetical protein